jgi:excisionase family DNA binding protein
MSFQSATEDDRRRLAGVLDSPQWAGTTVFTVRETTKILRVSPRHVYELGKRGDLPIIKLGRNIRIGRRTLQNMLGE